MLSPLFRRFKLNYEIELLDLPGRGANSDPLAMPMYALATISFVDQLSHTQDVTQIWYADDASAAGRITQSQNDAFTSNM